MAAPSSPRFSSLTGLWAAMPTPLAKDGALDEAAIAAHVPRWMDGYGLGGLIVGGDAGEGPALAQHERARLFTCVAGATRGRLIFDCTDPQAGRMVDLMALAGSLGAPCLVALPHLPGATAQDATLVAFAARAAACALVGLVLDIHPGAGYLVAPRLAARLAETPGVIALRYAAPAPLRAELARHLGGSVPLATTDPAIWLDDIDTLGAPLHLGGLAPLLLQTPGQPRLADLATALRDGRHAEASAIRQGIDPLRAALAAATPAEKPLAAAKHWLSLMGFPCGPVRPPWLPLTAREAARLDAAFADHAPA